MFRVSLARPSLLRNRQFPVFESKTARSGAWRGCETQSSRLTHPKHYDAHCQALRRVMSVTRDMTGLGSTSSVGLNLTSQGAEERMRRTCFLSRCMDLGTC